MERKPKLLKVLLTDYLLFLSFLCTIIFIGFGLYLKFIENESMYIIYIFSGLALLSLFIFIYRLLYLNDLFETGIVVDGVIKNIWFFKDRGRINYTYSYEGKEYSIGNAVMKNKKTKSLNKGLKVSIIVNKRKHNKAIIKDLYY